jgi:hypothetical protein
MTRPNKLDCLHLAKTFQSSLTFAGSTRILPKKEASERPSKIGFAVALPSNSMTRLERVTKGKPSSLFGLVISDEEKSFVKLSPGGNGKPKSHHWGLQNSYAQVS